MTQTVQTAPAVSRSQMVSTASAEQKVQRVYARKPEVCVIPATKRSAEGGGQIKKQKSLRVAAYCRVSTEDESQQTSYTTQKAFYTRMITGHMEWTLADIYADEAISGTSRAKRKGFNRMMDDAQAGKMDYIVTKSISRFARNTVDTLNCVRQLRQLNPPVGIFFEKENIDTLDATGELILTILSALAQDESRSISDNIRWSIQKKFQRGEAMVDLNRMLGYDKGPDGEWLINPVQAEIVRYIFERFVCGVSSNSIAKELNAMGKKTARGSIWRADAVLYILRNEKYVGDCESQKTVTKNFLTHEASINNGEAPKYYVADHHVGIIDRLTWDKVQAMLLNRCSRSNERGAKPKQRRGNNASPFTNLICSVDGCGEKMFRLGYNTPLHTYTDSRSAAAEGLDPAMYKERYYFYYPVWRCTRNAQKTKNHPKGRCASGSIYEAVLEQSFMEMLYKLKRDHDANGDASQLTRLFRKACERVDRLTSSNLYSVQRLEMLELQIEELEENLHKTVGKQADALRYAAIEKDELLKQSIEDEKITMNEIEVELHNDILAASLETQRTSEEAEEGSEAAIYANLAEDIRKRMEELKKERAALEAEQGATTAMRKNFDFFLRCLRQLPEENHAGMKMNVNGLDVEGSLFRDIEGKAKAGKRSSAKSGHIRITEEKIKAAPDYLNFEKGIYIAFIKSGLVKGDEVEYTTNFGVRFTSKGNRRTLGSFLGFRRAQPDGTVEFLDEIWKVSNRGVCYTRKEIKDSDRMYNNRV